MNWSTKISLVGTILLVAFVTIWQLPKSIQIVIGAGIGFSVVVLALAIVTYFCLIGWQKLQQERMATKQAGYESEIKRYVTKKDGHGMLHLLDVATGHSQNLTIDARAYRNGHYEEPSLSEARNYALAMAKSQRQIDSVAGQMVIEPTVQQDLLDIINRYPHTHFWGGTGDGKSSILRTVGFNRRELGHQVYVLDSNDHPAMWDGLERIMDTQEQDDFIARALAVHKVNSEALAAGRAIESDFKQITILSNEWTDIVRRTDTAAQFIDEMSRKSRKSGFHCVFATQTKLATDLGLDGRYQVIRNFVQIELIKNPSGLFMARAVYGGNKLGEFSVPVPPAKPAMLSSGYTPPSIKEVSPDFILDKKTSDKDIRIIEMIQAGATDSEIAQECFGKPNLVGGNFYKVKELRQRFTT